MKSLCVKTNDIKILEFLKDRLLKLDLESVCFSENEFKIYKNIIMHSLDNNSKIFTDKICSILTETIIYFYEKKLLKRILDYNYFYFNSAEKRNILEIAHDFLADDSISAEDNYFAIYSSVFDYINENHSIVLEGFVNFRLSNYVKNLDYIIDLAVNKYITDKEYFEFVNMLKLYISITPSKAQIVHLIYLGKESILLDKDKNIIPLEDENLNTKYLSDFTFSSNDYALNTLLNIVPKKLIIHSLTGKTDEFINTLKLIFDKRFEICSSCELCRLYKISFN